VDSIKKKLGEALKKALGVEEGSIEVVSVTAINADTGEEAEGAELPEELQKILAHITAYGQPDVSLNSPACNCGTCGEMLETALRMYEVMRFTDCAGWHLGVVGLVEQMLVKGIALDCGDTEHARITGEASQVRTELIMKTHSAMIRARLTTIQCKETTKQ
jgi:hypothetical protein